MKLGRRELTNIALVVLALGTFVAVYFTRARPTTLEQAQRENNLIRTWREDQVSRIQIEQGKERLVLERAPEQPGVPEKWHITAPLKEEANLESVDHLIHAIGFATAVREISEADRNKLGLSSPRRRVTVQMGELKFVIAFGNDSPTPRGAVYAEVSGDGQASRVVIAKADLFAELSPDPNRLRPKSLVNFEREHLGSLTIQNPTGRIELTQDGRRFRIASGEHKGVRADRGVLDAVLLQLTRLQVEPFIGIETAQAALSKGESVQVTLGKDQKRSELSLGGTCPADPARIVALRSSPSPRAGCVPRNALPVFMGSPASFVDVKAFSLNADEVEELTLENGREKLSMVRKGSGFMLRAPSEAHVELQLGNRRISELLRPAELAQTRDLKKLGLDPPRGKAKVRSSGADERSLIEETVLVGQPLNGDVYLFREYDAAILKLDAESARAFLPDSTLLRSSKIWQFGLSDVARVSTKTESFNQVLERDATGNLNLVEPKGFSHDGGLAVDLIQSLGALSTDRWVVDHDDGSFGFDKPRVRIEVALSEGDAGAKTHKLVVGSLTSGGAFAKVDDDPAVFVLAREELELYQTLAIDRSLFMVNPEDVKAIKLEARGRRSTTLRRKADSFVSRDGELHTSSVARIVDALSTLRAEAAVALGPAKPDMGFAEPVLVIHIEPDTAMLKPRTFTIGASDEFHGTKVRFARVDGVNATFVIPKSKLDAIEGAL